MSEAKQRVPPQKQERQPGREREMRPRPDYTPRYPGSNRLVDKVALITGGDSGIGRAVAVLFAREGANLALVYLEESEDAERRPAQFGPKAGAAPQPLVQRSMGSIAAHPALSRGDAGRRDHGGLGCQGSQEGGLIGRLSPHSRRVTPHYTRAPVRRQTDRGAMSIPSPSGELFMKSPLLPLAQRLNQAALGR
jgi:hypothetical protein